MSPWPYAYAALDLLFAAVYVLIATTLLESSTGEFQLGSYALGAAAALAGIGMALRNRAGWWLAVGGCALILVGAVTLLVLLALSAAFMHGVYGSMGKAASAVTLVMAALAVELYVLLPAFQLRYLLGGEGRRFRA